MFLPHTYQAALMLMILSMLCWGSWANTLKLCPRFRFQLFYWDYALGLAAGALFWGLTAGSFGSQGPAFLTAVTSTPMGSILFATAGGAVFNVANLLLVAAIDVAGLAVAFPVGIGLALVVGAVSSYLVSPTANPLLLFGGVALVVVAIVLDAAAYRKREGAAQAATRRGIVLSLAAGVLMGLFYPLVARAMSFQLPGAAAGTLPGPYAIALFFAVGVLVSTVPANLLLMAHPLDGRPPVDAAGYARAPIGWHLAGVLGGAIWCTGTVSNFVASSAHMVGPAVSYSIGQGATMVSACWGVFIWREFAGAPRAARWLLFAMFVFFALGLGAVALAPLY
jgi:glucose uptake protein